MTIRRIALGELRVGHLFHAEYPNGAKVIGLTLEVMVTRIKGRDICRQEELEIDRQTGISIENGDEVRCTIFSTEQLPPDLHNTMIGLDQKYGSGRPLTSEETKLTPAEKKALILINP